MSNYLTHYMEATARLKAERDEARAEIKRLTDSMNRRAFLLADARRARDQAERQRDALHNALGRLTRAVERLNLREPSGDRYGSAWEILLDAAHDGREALDALGDVHDSASDLRDRLQDVVQAARPVVNRLWETGENQAAEAIRLGEALDKAEKAHD